MVNKASINSSEQIKLDQELFGEILSKHKKVLFIFDYDGTLCELVRDHNSAKLNDKQVEIINNLVKTPDTKVSIATGRSLDNLKELLGGRLSTEITLYGSHGAEKGEALVDNKIKNILNEIKSKLSDEGYIFFEEKPISLTIHFKKHPNKDTLILKLEKLAKNYSELFRVQMGHEVFEYLPKNIDKGIAIRDLAKSYPDYFPIFFGDDLTDNFGFKVINEINGLSVQVGERISEREAGYLINRVDDTYSLVKFYLKRKNSNESN